MSAAMTGLARTRTSRHPGFFEGAGVALGASIAVSIAYAGLSDLLNGALVLRLIVALTGLGYVVYLLTRSRERTGRIAVLGAWLAITALTLLIDPPLAGHLLAQLATVWLIRTLYFHSSVLASLADLALVAFGGAALVWALGHTGSLLLGVWCLMLVQASFVWIPQALPRTGGHRSGQPLAEDRFERAHRSATTVLERLSRI